MSFRKREKEYEAAEKKYRTGLIRIIRQAFLIRPPVTRAGLRSINITNELKRPITKKKLYDITEELYNLGTKHGTELIEELKPKTTSAAGRTTRPFLAAAEPYNQRLINGLTEHTVTNMAYIADDAKADLITSLEEGYAQGEGIPALTKRVQQTWDESRVRAVRFARTFTNEVYNQAHYNRYQDSGIVDGVQFSAHLDSRTSEQCRMLNMTIWALGDPAIQSPPLHFNCRSRLLPFFGKVPEKRDFRKSYDGVEYSKTDIAKVQKQIEVFRSKYWKVPLIEVPKIPLIPIKKPKITTVDTIPAEIKKIDRFVDIKNAPPVYKKLGKPLGTSLDGAKINVLKSINKGLERSIGKYDVKINHVGWQQKRSQSAAVFTYSGSKESGYYTTIQFQKTATKNAIKIQKNTIEAYAINKNKAIDRIDNILITTKNKPQAQAMFLTEKEKLKLSKRWAMYQDADDPLLANTIHEGQHAIMHHKDLKLKWQENLQKEGILTMSDPRIYGVSDYAATNFNELWAEVGTAIELNIDIPTIFKTAYKATISGAT